MPIPVILSPSEQVAAHLRDRLQRGVWTGAMPGVIRLEGELGVNRTTVEAALRLLEAEGILVGQGAGRARQIAPRENRTRQALRVAIVEYDPEGKTDAYTVELRYLLTSAGHTAFFTPSTLTELGMDVQRIAKMVEKTEADAWLVAAGSREVLKWFSTRPSPAFAWFGRMEGLPIAGTKPDKRPAYAAAARQLIALGHRLITLLVQPERRLPKTGRHERVFLDELESHGIRTGPYNLPDWEDNPEGFHRGLNQLFRVTPPTALIVDTAPLFFAAHQFLGNRGFRVPEDVSLICTDGDPAFEWLRPTVAQIRWDSQPVVRNIVRWANNVAKGKEDKKQTFTKAEYVPGGTVGMATG